MIKPCESPWNGDLPPEMTTEGVDTFIRYADGAVSRFPKNFIVLDGTGSDNAVFQMGRNSFIGQNSKVSFDKDCSLEVGNFCSISYGVNFLTCGQHPVNTISTYNFECIAGFENEMKDMFYPRRSIIVKNDVWIGKNAFLSGDTVVGNGVVIGTHCLVTHGKKLEDYGIYVGMPAKLVRFRFPENIIALLNTLAWYDMPIAFIRQNADFFKVDLNLDVGKSVDLLQALIEKKQNYVLQAAQCGD